MKAAAARPLTRAGSTTPRQARTPLPHLAAPVLRRGVEAPWRCRAVVREPSFVTCQAAGTASVEDGTHPHNLPQQAPACSPAPRPSRRGAGRADPAQPVRRCLRGAKLRAAGIARRAFPWRQAKHAAPQARRREGLKPNGRDSEVARGAARKPGGAVRRHAQAVKALFGKAHRPRQRNAGANAAAPRCTSR